jgi:hypothetical protein
MAFRVDFGHSPPLNPPKASVSKDPASRVSEPVAHDHAPCPVAGKDWEAFRDLNNTTGFGRVVLNATHLAYQQVEATKGWIVDSFVLRNSQVPV